MNILVVEDECSIREILTTIAEMTFPNTQVVGAACGRDALNAVKAKGMPNLVLLDLGLPDMSGFDVMAALRNMGCKAKVVIITAEDDPIQRSRAARMGVDLFIPKPFDSRKLRTILRNLLDAAVPDAASIRGAFLSLTSR